jgi:protein subunit release factor B
VVRKGRGAGGVDCGDWSKTTKAMYEFLFAENTDMR